MLNKRSSTIYLFLCALLGSVSFAVAADPTKRSAAYSKESQINSDIECFPDASPALTTNLAVIDPIFSTSSTKPLLNFDCSPLLTAKKSFQITQQIAFITQHFIFLKVKSRFILAFQFQPIYHDDSRLSVI